MKKERGGIDLSGWQEHLPTVALAGQKFLAMGVRAGEALKMRRWVEPIIAAAVVGALGWGVNVYVTLPTIQAALASVKDTQQRTRVDIDKMRDDITSLKVDVAAIKQQVADGNSVQHAWNNQRTGP